MTIEDERPMPNDFAWWMAEGEHPEMFTGPFASREAAIAEARGYGYDAAGERGFTIQEADKEDADLTIDGEDALDRWNDNNAEHGDPDGDPIIDATREQVRDLGAMLSAAFAAWVSKHKIVPYIWQFGTVRNKEFFPAAPLPTPTETSDGR